MHVAYLYLQPHNIVFLMENIYRNQIWHHYFHFMKIARRQTDTKMYFHTCYKNMFIFIIIQVTLCNINHPLLREEFTYFSHQVANTVVDVCLSCFLVSVLEFFRVFELHRFRIILPAWHIGETDLDKEEEFLETGIYCNNANALICMLQSKCCQ